LSIARRYFTRARFLSERKVAFSGKSLTIKNEAMAMQSVTRPSIMKIQDQPCRPPSPSILSIAHARRPPQEPATAAAEKKVAARMPNSERLYQQLK